MPQAKLYNFFLVLFIFAFALSVSAQTLTETHQKIRLAVENRDYQTAISELENLEKSDKRIFALNNYDYLLARMAEKRGDFAAAMANYQAVANRNSVLSEYALWHLSQIAHSSGNLLLERIYLQKILTLAPESLLTDATQTRMARSYFESKNFDVTIQILNSQKSVNGKGQTTKEEGRTRENLVLLGQAYLQVGKLNEAREVFTRLTNNLSNPAQPDDFALAGAKSLDELDGGLEKFGKTAPQLPETEHLRRATIYQFNRNFPLARLHFQAIVERFPNSSYVSNALYQIGRGFAQEENYAQAINLFERLQAQFPDDDVSRDALSQTASAYIRVNQPTEAILRYQKFIEKYPNADNLERAFLNIVDILRDAGNDVEALNWTAKTQTAFKGELPEAIALFAQARIHITQNDWKNALFDLNNLLAFTDLGGTRVPGGTNKAEITFLKGFALENSNRYPEAIDTYLLIPDGRSEYYGWRATERLRALVTGEKARPFITQKLGELTANIETRNAEAQRKAAQSALRLTNAVEIQAKMLAIVRKSYLQLPEYQKIPNAKLLEVGRKEVLKEKRDTVAENQHKTLADELLFLGLYDEGTPELEKSRNDSKNSDLNNPKSNDLNYTLAVFYKRGDIANRAVAYIEPLWKNIPADYQLELIPREQIELLYPTPYTDALLQFAPPGKVDPRFLLAIMRQESRYRADVKSYAAARGLMQFISTTAEKIARELDKENFNQDELYHPPTAILFGSRYLSNLFKIFPNQPPAVAASYNGGEDNMTRWFARSKSNNPDRYVPEIVFSQSKDYVYKVMANYRVYQMFYDENLKVR
ncbi:MAG: transglycosylase SLT domain-containing protein [Acidobacteriota bacterium]|nr:transglycosylase SLT domain-containing protein [Acidobacteriota bacterium]